MSLREYTDRVKAAVARVSHYSATITLADRRIKRWRKEYLIANRAVEKAEPDAEAKRTRIRKKLIYWKARKFKAEDLRHNWRDILKGRRAAKRRYLKNHPPLDTNGFATYDGLPVAPWMVGLVTGPDGTKTNWLAEAKRHGWKGTVVSGVRTAAHSVELCEAMCGSTSCPGRCAGATSNHNCSPGCPEPEGAIDVTDFSTFKAIMQEIGAPLKNDLPIDPVHFSFTGH